MYEKQLSINDLLEPTALVERVNEIISNIIFENINFHQKDKILFKNKSIIPMSQVFALYAINKITSKANK